MKNKIEFFYNIKIAEIKNYELYSIISSDGNNYILKKINNPEELLHDNLKINEIRKVIFLLPVLNKNNNYITMIDEKKYILLKVNAENYNLYDHMPVFTLPNNEEKYTSTLWCEKNDYFRKQLINFFTGADVTLINLFNYYSGMAENAIAIMRKYEESIIGTKRYLSHSRIYYPNNTINFYDPTEYIIDYKSRDYAEYIKSKIMKGEEINLNLMVQKIREFQYDEYDIIVFYCRLLYPTYFFDYFEKNLLKIDDFDSRESFFDKVCEYEKIIKKIYFECLQINPGLPKIEWLIDTEL